MGSDTLGKCGTWTCGLLAGLDMEDPEDSRAKETLKRSSLLLHSDETRETEVRQSNAIVGFGYL